jgi:eukaryotic-like serine/threonine-protein kinase
MIAATSAPDQESTLRSGSPAESWSGRDEAATPTPAVAEGHVVSGRYRLRTRLGVGGMGEVWLADDSFLRRQVALKRNYLITVEGDPDVLREARAAARVAHPGVVRVHDIALDLDGNAWMVMEALEGPTLTEMLLERGRLSMDEIVVIGLQLLSALQAIHAEGLVHRDVKPANIHVCGRRRVILTDFGLSTLPGNWGGLIAGSGAVAGSLSYLAPESILHGQFGPASDLYALGVTLYRAVEGRRPFEPCWPLDGLAATEARPLQHAGRVGPVITGLLDPDPTRRLDAAEAMSRLEAMTLVAAMPWAQ